MHNNLSTSTLIIMAHRYNLFFLNSMKISAHTSVGHVGSLFYQNEKNNVIKVGMKSAGLLTENACENAKSCLFSQAYCLKAKRGASVSRTLHCIVVCRTVPGILVWVGRHKRLNKMSIFFRLEKSVFTAPFFNESFNSKIFTDLPY